MKLKAITDMRVGPPDFPVSMSTRRDERYQTVRNKFPRPRPYMGACLFATGRPRPLIADMWILCPSCVTNPRPRRNTGTWAEYPYISRLWSSSTPLFRTNVREGGDQVYKEDRTTKTAYKRRRGYVSTTPLSEVRKCRLGGGRISQRSKPHYGSRGLGWSPAQCIYR